MTSYEINTRCRYHRGDRPCSFNKRVGATCAGCAHVSEYRSRILIIKLDALGDVLRTGSLLPFIRARHDQAHVSWLTRPSAVDMASCLEGVDEVIALDTEGLARVSAGGWDEVYSLSNDPNSAALATAASPSRPAVGFSLRGGVLHPSNEAARHWMEMGVFDQAKRANTRTYQDHMLAILGTTGTARPPRLTIDAGHREAARRTLARLFPGNSAPVVALNVGAGPRWPKKMLDVAQIAELATRVVEQLEARVVLVGGALEAARTSDVLRLCGRRPEIQAALTPEGLKAFAAMLGEVDVLVCGDTLALHVGSAMGTRIVCVVGPTSAAELAEFDGQVVKVTAAQLPCLGCYGDCAKSDNCMSLLRPEELTGLVGQQLGRGRLPSRPAA